MLNPATGQLPFVEVIFWQFNPLARRNRQLVSCQVLRCVDRVIAGELENDSISVELMLFNLQRSSACVGPNCHHTLKAFETSREIRVKVGYHFSAEAPGPGHARDDNQIIGHFTQRRRARTGGVFSNPRRKPANVEP
jgi:hypothetical protein